MSVLAIKGPIHPKSKKHLSSTCSVFHLDSLGVIIRQVLEISAVKLLPSLENNFIVVLKVRYHFLSVSRFSVSSFTLEIFVFEAG